MRSPTAALLEDLWRRQRPIFIAALACTAAGRLLEWHLLLTDGSTLAELLRMLSFVLAFGGFSWTESADGHSLGRFPRRLFTLPVTTVRLVAVPVVAGIVAIELLYLLWLAPVPDQGPMRVALNATLLATLMVSTQAALWTLDRLGTLRLVIVGLLVVAAFGVSLVPDIDATRSLWRTEGGVSLLTAAAGVVIFGVLWQQLARMRAGGGRVAWPAMRIGAPLATAWPRRTRPFPSAAAAHAWYEWRTAGIVLPMVTLAVLAFVVAPLSWLERSSAGDTLRLLVGTLAAPILLAIPVGLGHAKPRFWSDDLSVPAFLALRPLPDRDLVAAKVRGALVSALAAWTIVLAFIAIWFAGWAALDEVRDVATHLTARHGQSRAALPALTVLFVTAGVGVTWRFLVSRLWIGLAGRRPWFMVSAVCPGVIVGAALTQEPSRLPGWLLADPGRVDAAVAIALVLLAVKSALAAYAWRLPAAPRWRNYLPLAIVAAAAFTTLALVIVRLAQPQTGNTRLALLAVLVSLLAVPVARPGIAATLLSRNRHR